MSDNTDVQRDQPQKPHLNSRVSLPDRVLVRLWMQLGHLGLHTRIFLMTGLGLLVILTIFGLLGLSAVQESTRQSLDQHLVIARLVADKVDNEVTSVLEILTRLAGSKELDLEDGDLEPERALLQAVQSQATMHTHRLIVMDNHATVLWSEPLDPAMIGWSMLDRPEIEEALRTQRPTVSNLVLSMPAGAPVVLLTVPIRSREGRIAGLLTGEIEPGQGNISEFLQPLRLSGTAHIRIMDRQGFVLASTDPTGLLKKGDHGPRFAELIEGRQPAMLDCRKGCHEATPDPTKEVLAFVPLSTAPWAVAIRQPEAEVLAPSRQLQRQLILVGAVILIGALLIGWFSTEQVVRPLRSLMAAVSAIAAGNLDVPVPNHGTDEVGRLARAFEEMRIRLKDSVQAMERLNADLEQRVQERTRQLATLYDELRRKEEIRTGLLAKLVSAQEDERKRIARELHDEVGQTLTSVIMNIGAVEQSLPDELNGSKARLAATRDVAAQALRELRALIFDLRPEVLDDLGLVLAVRGHAKERLEELGIKVQVQVSGLPRRLPPEIEIMVFRMLQEAITNIRRHAQATEVRIGLQRVGSHLLVTVEDNGVGFDPQTVLQARRDSQRWGMRGMSERIALLNGRFNVYSQPGHGTRLEAEIPLENWPEQEEVPERA